MAATNYSVIRRRIADGTITITNLEEKTTYKIALYCAKQATTESYELVCVVETNKIMLKNEKETEN